MHKLNNLSLKSVVLIAFVAGVLMGSGVLFYLNYSPPAQADDQIEFKAEAYKDLVRFKAEGGSVSKVGVEIYDLSGRRMYQGETTNQALDWYRTSTNGERLTKGTYLYVTKAYSNGSLVKTSGIGKMYVSPDSVNLQSAPPLKKALQENKEGKVIDTKQSLQPKSVDVNHLGESWAFGKVGVGTDSPGQLVGGLSGFDIEVRKDGLSGFAAASYENDPVKGAGFLFGFARGSKTSPSVVQEGDRLGFFLGMGYDGSGFLKPAGVTFKVDGPVSSGSVPGKIAFETGTSWQDRQERLVVNSSGDVGIGVSNPTADLEVHGSNSNLLALYNTEESTTDPKFRVEKDGDVYADGHYYGAGESVISGGADVAERINTSEWVEKGNVVEIDPKHQGFFRKTRESYSTKVAGVISSNPGVILGNNRKNNWEDNRPMLALAGRVPVKAIAENGGIEVGDLLVSSSTPGYAMTCKEGSKCAGAIIGKALEPLKGGKGKIMVQVSLG